MKVRYQNLIIIAVLIGVLYLLAGCEDDEIRYQRMHVFWAQTWECYEEKGLNCGNRGFETPEEWFEFYGGEWDVNVEYANRTVGRYHFKPVE